MCLSRSEYVSVSVSESESESETGSAIKRNWRGHAVSAGGWKWDGGCSGRPEIPGMPASINRGPSSGRV